MAIFWPTDRWIRPVDASGPNAKAPAGAGAFVLGDERGAVAPDASIRR